MPPKPKRRKQVETLRHDEAKRTNIPTAEYSSAMEEDDRSPIEVAYARRNRDLDPQLVWRGKDEQDLSDLVVQAPPLYIQEKVHPKVLIDDLRRRSEQAAKDDAIAESGFQSDLFADFNGLPEGADRTDFYEHDANWSNRMILGDSLQVMASLAEREGLRGKVQCIYIDPPYGIKFNSNFQWSTTSREVRDGNIAHATREPEQVKAFRDTWRDGIHSYLSYLRDRLELVRDLLADSGSVFVQIGDENVHLVRAMMDEILGQRISSARFHSRRPQPLTARLRISTPWVVSQTSFFGMRRTSSRIKYRGLFQEKELTGQAGSAYRSVLLPNGERRRLKNSEVIDGSTLPQGARIHRIDNLTSPGWSDALSQPFGFEGHGYTLSRNLHWKTTPLGLRRLSKAQRVVASGRSLAYVRFFDDFAVVPRQNVWTDTATGGFGDERYYVVQTVAKVIQRCVLMVTDPGDLVLDPTCGSGTTAHVAEQWGRRWITVDTSRVALALARARIMGARYPVLLAR